MRYNFEQCHWPAVWLEKEQVEGVVTSYTKDGIPPPRGKFYKITTFRRFELNLHALDKRYVEGDEAVRREFVVQITKRRRKKEKLIKGLEALSQHSATNEHERSSAEARLRELNKQVVDLVRKRDPNLERQASIDRRRLFVENLEVLVEGRCGRPEKPLAPWYTDCAITFIVYVRSERELEKMINLAHEATDQYLNIPKRFGARDGERML